MPCRDQGAQRPDHFHQARRQGDLLLRLAQGGAHQVGIFRVAPPAGEGDLAAMGGQTGGAQGQHQLRIVAAGDGHQHGRLGEALVGIQLAGAVRLDALAQLVERAVHTAGVSEVLSFPRDHGTKAPASPPLPHGALSPPGQPSKIGLSPKKNLA